MNNDVSDFKRLLMSLDIDEAKKKELEDSIAKKPQKKFEKKADKKEKRATFVGMIASEAGGDGEAALLKALVDLLPRSVEQTFCSTSFPEAHGTWLLASPSQWHNKDGYSSSLVFSQLNHEIAYEKWKQFEHRVFPLTYFVGSKVAVLGSIDSDLPKHLYSVVGKFMRKEPIDPEEVKKVESDKEEGKEEKKKQVEKPKAKLVGKRSTPEEDFDLLSVEGESFVETVKASQTKGSPLVKKKEKS